jgi:ATP-dependent Clp protease ATP-binding subunit ClpC
MFKPLGRPEIHKIIDLELDHLYNRIKNLGYFIEMTDKAKDFIVDKGYDEKFGARPLKRAIQKFIEDPLAEEIINTNLAEGDTILLDIEAGKEELTLTIKKPKAVKKAAKK